ncbi:TetR/AcrR family transcriptional regulator [Porphyromonas cangingivalis]|uniref:TetR/AcrR family transcriptional regulator n=1 Tax=Porphyromonas cangingivalis TaxID=36874 RepID=UPI0024300E24|nr:TetR/AcrR family transcriptional regulator [Porphyromonas cangingivalis]
MQKIKDHTRLQLLNTAREAFFKKGFKAVSMREISQKSGVGLSNIYNYYPNKDSLLADVLKPLLDDIESMMQEHNAPGRFTVEIFTSEELLRHWIERSLRIVFHYRRELKLLLFESQGSGYQHHVREWAESEASEMGRIYLDEMKTHYPQLYTDISPLFMHFASSLWLNMLRVVVLHEELTKKEVENFVEEFVRFSTGGWGKLLRAEQAIPSDLLTHQRS